MSRRIKVKPGKTQSTIGFGVGIVFVLIGCVIVIPTFGIFGIFWTIIAGFIAYSHYKNAFTEEGMATHEIVIDEEYEEDGLRKNRAEEYYTTGERVGAELEREEEDIEVKLKKLESLYSQNLITRDEYEAKRKEFLDNF